MSLDITKRIILSAENTKPNVRISIKQGCINTVTLLVSINNHGGLLEFPVGSTAKVRMLKPDGNQVLNDCSISGNNTVNVVFTEQMQAYPGDGLCEVIILSGAKRLTSATFPVYIEPTVHDDSQLESLPEYTSLINALIAVDGKMDKQGDSADNIVTFEEAAEDADITSGEKHSAIFGKLLKSIKTLRSGKINKTDIIQNDTVGGVDKVASGELVKTHRQDIGTLSSLKTTNKTSLVAAINEQNDNLADFRYIKIGEGTVIPKNSSGNITIPTNISGTYLLTLQTTNATGWRYAGICWLHGVAASRNRLIEIEKLNLTVSLTDNVLTITNDSPQYNFTTTLILVRIG